MLGLSASSVAMFIVSAVTFIVALMVIMALTRVVMG